MVITLSVMVLLLAKGYGATGAHSGAHAAAGAPLLQDMVPVSAGVGASLYGDDSSPGAHPTRRATRCAVA
jgi:hypothetical protein